MLPLRRRLVLPPPTLPIKAREAQSIADLRRIREANREAIERVNGNLGSALGFKYSNGVQTQHPAVLVFVPAKVRSSELAASERLPAVLTAVVNNEQIWAHTDVIEGGKAPTYTAPKSPLSQANRTLVAQLQSGNVPLQGGVALYGVDKGDDGRYAVYRGTIAAIVTDGGKYYALTNQHVAGAVNNRLYRSAADAQQAARSLNLGATPDPRHIGVTVISQEYVANSEWLAAFFGGTSRSDFALVELQPTENFDPARDTRHGVFNLSDHIAEPEVNNEDAPGLKPIGSFVQRVGTTRGLQTGVIAAVAYEYDDFSDQPDLFTDYLILSDDSGAVFSDRGDSGSLIVGTDTPTSFAPLALLWGGWDERLRRDRGQENWTYAVSIPRILAFLKNHHFAVHF